MSRYIKGEDKNQLSILPMSLNELIPEEHPVRVIDAFVDTLDMEKLGFKYANTKNTGRKPYDPKHLLKLYIYGYLNGLRSTRKLEREAYRNIEVMWLIDQLKPDDKTISNFRKDNQNSLTGVFKEFSMLCSELGLYGKQMVAVDGSKFRACNSRRKNFTKRKVKKMLEHYEKCAEEYINLLQENDKTEEIEPKIRETKEDIENRLKAAKKRIEELKEMAEEIEENGEISISDPDARHMSVSNNGTDISHNVQISVDAKNHLVVAVDVVSTPADQNQLHNMVIKTIEALGIKDEIENQNDEDDEIITVLADKGYYCGEELQKCKDDKVKTIVAKQKSSTKNGNENYAKDQFIYDKEKDIYLCPEGQELINSSRFDAKEKVYKNPKACNQCEVRDTCTGNKRGRFIKRGPYQEVYDEVDKRTEENKALYKQRQMIVEHPFATVKRSLGFSYFLTRGNENVKAESFMHFFTYNFIRVMNIVGIKELINELRTRKKGIFCLMEQMPLKLKNIRLIITS